MASIVQDVALSVFLAVASVSVGTVAYSVVRTTAEIPKEIATTRQRLIEEIRDTRAEATQQIVATRTQLVGLTDKHLTQIEADLNYKLDQTEIDLNARLNDTNKVLNHALSEYDQTALITVASTLQRVDPIAARLTSVLDKVDQQEPMYYSRFLATTGELNKTLDATRRMAEAGAMAAPAFTKNMTDLTGNAATVAEDVHYYTKPKGLFRGTIVPAIIGAARFVIP